MLVGGLIVQEKEESEPKAVPAAPEPQPVVAEPVVVAPVEDVAPTYPYDRLPSECKQCGGPIRGHDVQWATTDAADCPYCGANLQLV